MYILHAPLPLPLSGRWMPCEARCPACVMSSSRPVLPLLSCSLSYWRPDGRGRGRYTASLWTETTSTPRCILPPPLNLSHHSIPDTCIYLYMYMHMYTCTVYVCCSPIPSLSRTYTIVNAYACLRDEKEGREKQTRSNKQQDKAMNNHVYRNTFQI